MAMNVHAELKRLGTLTTPQLRARYSPRLHKLASALVQEWADEVLFATYKVHIIKVDEGFNKAKHNGVCTGERIIRTVERPAHVAKNRLGLPEELPLDFRIYGAFARGENPFAEAPAPAAPALATDAAADGSWGE